MRFMRQTNYYKIFGHRLDIYLATSLLKSLNKRDFYLDNVPLRRRAEFEKYYDECEIVEPLSLINFEIFNHVILLKILKRFKYIQTVTKNNIPI